MQLKRRLTVAGLLVVCTTIGGTAYAQSVQSTEWPTRAVRWIVPFGAGGTADAAARHITQKLSERWGQSIIIENRPGGNTSIAASEAARSAPDGYTLFQPMNSTFTVNPFVFNKLPYDPGRDFTPIGMLVSVPLIVVANDSMPAKTIEEYIELVKKSPDSVTLGTGDIGVQLNAERFLRAADIKARIVPYKSGADVMRGLLSSEIQSGLDGVPAYPPYIKSGKLRPLATNSPTRISALPDVPTLKEVGLENSGGPLWHGLVAPTGVSPAIQKKISDDLKVVLAMPDLRAKIQELGLEPNWLSQQAFVEQIKDETAQMEPVIKELGIKLSN